MGRPALTIEAYQERLDTKWPGRFAALGYFGMLTPAPVRCLTCEEEFLTKPNSLLIRGCCSGCGKQSGQHTTEKALAKAEEVAAKAGHELLHHEKTSGRHTYFFTCPKHGKYAVKRIGYGASCPKCKTKAWFAPTHPNSIPRKLRSKACVLYLITVRDCAGVWTKIGISTNWESRKRHMKKDGVDILSELRMHRTTLFEANTIEWATKKWARGVLGRRGCPRRKWSGWSECFKDPLNKLPKEFDRVVRGLR